jgi:hypothetical protein
MTLDWIRGYRAWVLLLVSLGLSAAQAAGGKSGAAELRLAFTSHGSVDVYLVVFVLPQKPAVLESAMEEALGLKLKDVDWDIDEHKHVVSLYARSSGAFAHDLLSVRGQIQFSPLWETLASMNVQTCEVSFTHPRAGFSQFTLGDRVSAPENPVVEYLYRPSLTRGEASTLRFDYGFDRAEAGWAAAPLLGLVMLPFGARLVSRRRSSGERVDGWSNWISRWVAGQTLVAWLAWCLLLYALRGDLIAWFLTGADGQFARIGTLSGVIWLPVALLGAVGLRLAGPVRGESWSLVRRAELMLLLPTVLAATGMLAERNTNTAGAAQWLVVAVLITLASMGAFIWSNAGVLGGAAPGEARVGWPQVVDQERRIILRYWVVQFATILAMPALAISWMIEIRLDDTERLLGLAGTLAACAGLMLLFGNLLPAWGLRALRLSSKSVLEKEVLGSAKVGGAFVFARGSGLGRRLPAPLGGESGWLLPVGERLCFFGSQTRWVLERRQIRQVRLGRPRVGWWRIGELEITWGSSVEDPPRTISIRSGEFASLRKSRAVASVLAERLRNWLNTDANEAGESPGLPDVPNAEKLWKEESDSKPGLSARTMTVPLVAVPLAIGIAELLGFPFDLSKGDEGWAMVVLASVAAVFQAAPLWIAGRRPALQEVTGNRAGKA